MMQALANKVFRDRSKPLLCIMYSRIQWNIYQQRFSDPGKYKPRKPSRHLASLYVTYVHSYRPELPIQYLGDVTTRGEPQVGHELWVRVNAIYIIHGRQVVQDGVVV